MGYNLRPPGLAERLLQVRLDPGGSSKLRKCLNLFQLVVQGLAHMLGAGIFVVTPSIVQSVAGPATCISYLLSGLAAAFSVACYSDLASRYLCTGSAYVYSYFSVGEFGAAVVGFFLIGELLVQAPALALGIAENVDEFISNGTVSEWELEHFPAWFLHTDLIAIGIMLLYMLINMLGIKSVSYINIAVAVVSVASLLVFCAVGLLYGNVENLYKPVNPTDGRTGFAPFGLSGIVSGAGTAFFAFVGLESVVTLAEESINPKKDLPRATIISFVVVMILYVMTAFSIAFFVPWYEVDGTTGLIGSLKSRGLVVPQYIVTVGLLFTVFSCGLCTLTTATRVVYSISADGLLPPFLSQVNSKTQVPIWNILLCALIGIGGSILYDFDTLLHMISGGTLMVFVMTAIAVMILSYDLSGDQGLETEQTPLTGSTSKKAFFYTCLCVFLTSCVLVTCLLAFVGQSPGVIAVEVCLLLVLACCLIVIRCKVPLNEDEGLLTVKIPGKPFVQGFCVLINLFLMFHLAAKALIQLAIYSAVGVAIYLGYGIFHSNITESKQKLLESQDVGL